MGHSLRQFRYPGEHPVNGADLLVPVVALGGVFVAARHLGAADLEMTSPYVGRAAPNGHAVAAMTMTWVSVLVLTRERRLAASKDS